jgi:hypothetical protein
MHKIILIQPHYIDAKRVPEVALKRSSPQTFVKDKCSFVKKTV